MKNKIIYKESVSKDLKRIDHKFRFKIKHSIEEKLSSNFRAGKQLKGSYSGLFSYRVGDYRAIYTMIPDGILILRIAYRKKVYRY